MFVLSGGGKNLVKVKKKDLESYTIPNSVTAIGKRAFKGCTSLQEVYIPSNVKNIGMEAFMDCTSLSVVRISEDIDSIGKGAFRNCTSLREVCLPDKANEIGREAFMNCTFIRTITIPEGVVKINNSCFSGCRFLEEIILPDSLIEMCEGAFRGCLSLKEIVIPQSVVLINKDCFSGCKSLGRVKLLNSQTSFDETSFSMCSNLSLELDPEEYYVEPIQLSNYSVLKDLYYSNMLSIEDFIDSLEFEVPIIPKDILIQLACDSLWNSIVIKEMWDVLYWEVDFSSPRKNGAKKLAKICLNYLRHEQTPYDRTWDFITWILREHEQVEEDEAYINQLNQRLKAKVNRVICNYYPWIAEHVDIDL